MEANLLDDDNAFKKFAANEYLADDNVHCRQRNLLRVAGVENLLRAIAGVKPPDVARAGLTIDDMIC